jgi:hypothetical protein
MNYRGNEWEKRFASSIMDNYYFVYKLSEKQKNVIKRYVDKTGYLEIVPNSKADYYLK